MTQEEKARAYDEALKKARFYHGNCPSEPERKKLEGMFPVLSDSEDERTRKWLLDYAIEMIAGLESDISLSTYDGIKGHDPEAEAELAQWQKARAYIEKLKDLDKMIVVSPEVWDKAISDAFENGKKEGEKQKDQKPKMTPKWLFRLEFKDSSCGLWYDGTGKWCFESGIGSISGCKTKTLPMDYDARYKQDGRDWFSSCSRKEDLMHWYSLEDAKELISKGFVFTRYLATEYHEYDQQPKQTHRKNK